MSEPEHDPMPVDGAAAALDAGEVDVVEVDVVEVDVVEVDVVEVDVVSVDVVEVDGDDLVEAVEEVEAVEVEAAVFEPTGEPRVDDAAARLRDIDTAPTSEHVEIFEDVHGRLQEALRDLGSTD